MNEDRSPLPDLGKAPAERAASAVLPAAALVWTAAELMHVTGIPGTRDTAVAAAGAWLVTWGAAGRGRLPAGLPAWTAVTGAWVTAAEVFGPLAWLPFPALSAAWLAIAWRAARAARNHDAVTAAREWREARADWLGRARAWHLGGSHLLDFERTRLGELYTVSTKGTGRRASHFVGHALEEVIAEAEDLALSRVRVTGHRLAGRIRISVRRTDPWADALLHPLVCDEPEVELPAARSIRQAAFIGQDPETGEVLQVPLWDVVGAKNVSVTGMVGAGKGVLLDNLSEWVTAAPDALQVRINLSDKGHAEIESWGPSCHLTAFGQDQKSRAAAVLRVVSGVIAWRTRAYKRGQYQPTPADPLIVVIVDESDEAAAVKRELDAVSTKGREYGVAYVHAGQRGTNDYSSAKQRSQDTVRCTGAVNRQGEVRHAAGNQARAVPDMASYGEGQPGVWSVARNGAGQRDGRTWVFAETPAAHGAEVERIAQERAFAQPELPAACREYLGEAYEALLATEVFARWARARGEGDALEEPGDANAAITPEVPASPASLEEPASGASPAVPAGKTAVADRDSLEEQWEMDMDEAGRAKLAAVHEKLGGVRRMLEETAARPAPPQVSREALAAHTAARWRQIAEEPPRELLGPLLEMLGEGTTISAAEKRFGVKKWQARKWLEYLRLTGAAYVDGERATSRWRLAPPLGGGDAPLPGLSLSGASRARARARAHTGDET